jgi:predicted dithiol-disulfide oxidoreductase (DUF899 family)
MKGQLVGSEGGNRIVEHPTTFFKQWLAIRKRLLNKKLTHLRDQLAAERRALPWVKIDTHYIFDAPEGKVTLADLFDGRSRAWRTSPATASSS